MTVWKLKTSIFTFAIHHYEQIVRRRRRNSSNYYLFIYLFIEYSLACEKIHGNFPVTAKSKKMHRSCHFVCSYYDYEIVQKQAMVDYYITSR